MKTPEVQDCKVRLDVRADENSTEPKTAEMSFSVRRYAFDAGPTVDIVEVSQHQDAFLKRHGEPAVLKLAQERHLDVDKDRLILDYGNHQQEVVVNRAFGEPTSVSWKEHIEAKNLLDRFSAVEKTPEKNYDQAQTRLDGRSSKEPPSHDR